MGTDLTPKWLKTQAMLQHGCPQTRLAAKPGCASKQGRAGRAQKEKF